MSDSRHSLKSGDQIDLEITTLVSDGRGLGRYSGQAVFVPDTLPGQKIHGRVRKAQKNFAEAELIAILQPSSEERDPVCPHFVAGEGGCGGCPWQTLPYDRQLFWKEKILRDALERVGHLSHIPLLPILPSPTEWRCRNKMAFAFGTDGKNPALGLRERSSHKIFPVSDCRMQSPETMLLLQSMRNFAESEKLTFWNQEQEQGLCRFFVVRETTANLSDPKISVNPDNAKKVIDPQKRFLAELIVSHDAVPKDFGKRLFVALRQDVPNLAGFVLSQRTAKSDIAYGEKILYSEGEIFLQERIGEASFTLSHDAFFQINSAGAALLYAEIARMLGDKKSNLEKSLWDLYCGVGSIGLYLVQSGIFADDVELLGVEMMAHAVKMAQKNATNFGLKKFRFIQGDVAKILHHEGAKLQAKPDIVIVDPPRAGLSDAVVSSLLHIKPKRLIYVSCNPATLARDAAKLTTAWQLCEIRPVDLFPQTPHVEAVSFFQCKQ